jgi:hypothetical protein
VPVRNCRQSSDCHAQPLAAAGPCSAALLSRERGKSFANFATLIADLKRSRWFLPGGWPEVARVERDRGWDRSTPSPGKMNRARRVGPAERPLDGGDGRLSWDDNSCVLKRFSAFPGAVPSAQSVECCQAHPDAQAFYHLLTIKKDDSSILPLPGRRFNPATRNSAIRPPDSSVTKTLDESYSPGLTGGPTRRSSLSRTRRNCTS